MSTLPENVATVQDLVIWNEMQVQLKKLKDEEMALRRRIFATYFPNPVEGTNNVPLAQDWILKATYPITRDIDIGALQALSPKLVEAAISVDKLIQYKPSLIIKEYRTLTAEQNHLFDQCLVIKPGSPALEIILPAKAKKVGETVWAKL